jgi:hypothetical protein
MSEAERDSGGGMIAARGQEPRDKAALESVLPHTADDNTYNVYLPQFHVYSRFET